MKKIIILIFLVSFVSCKGDKTNDFLLEDEVSDFASPYDEKPECDSEAEDKLIRFTKNEFMDFPYESARYVRMNECDYVIAVGTSALSRSKKNQVAARIAKIKAQNQATSLINQTKVTSAEVLKMGESVRNDNLDFYENFKSEVSGNLFGFVSGMQTLTAFRSSDKSTLVYILFKQI
mgnify:CR=1 FL=1|tara:strand:+ start:176 stop:706 length:531 start_codon:yes stop_codon:yes gene_type:complete